MPKGLVDDGPVYVRVIGNAAQIIQQVLAVNSTTKTSRPGAPLWQRVSSLSPRQRGGVSPKRKAMFNSKSSSRALRFSSPRRILSGVPQLAAFKKLLTAPSRPSRTSDFRFLLIGVVTLHRLEVIAKKFVVIKVVLNKFVLVLRRFFFTLRKIRATYGEFGKHHSATQ